LTAPPVDETLVAFAGRLADAAGAAIRPYFRTSVAVDVKPDLSPVTAADRAAETAMRRLIEAEFPAHGIIGEEFGAAQEGAEHVWAVDPIDGTKSFISGLPIFGTLVALLRRGEPVIGIIDQPISRERWLGVAGRPTTLDGAPVRVRACAALTEASLFSTAPEMFAGAEAASWARLSRAVRMVRHGADCYAYGLLAAGFIDLVVESDLKLWDWAPMAPIIAGAGGIVTAWDGAPMRLGAEGRVLAAGDARAHAAAVARLAGV
jgi:inositol-phosphate phosphatase / L-galactose 1-phosphate phosphatase / histidinol-phosphatase